MAACGITGDIPPPQSAPVPSRRLDHAIRRHIEAVLLEMHGNQTLAASELGISRSQLQERLNRWARKDGADGAKCLHCGWHRLIKVDGPDGYYKCLRCRSGFAHP